MPHSARRRHVTDASVEGSGFGSIRAAESPENTSFTHTASVRGRS
jgi:hypothetical protein